MEKGKIKSFAINARNELIRDITQRLENYGIDKDGVKSELDISTPEIKYYTSEHFGLSGSQIKWRHKVVNELKRRANEVDWQQAFTDLVEEVAYTWFNRIIAIRFMEVNDYLPTRTRVLSSEEGRSEPDILIHALELEEDFGHYSDEEREIITRALDTLAPHDLDQMYEIMFIKQSDALQQVLPHLFEPTADYMKLLFTLRYNRGVIKELLTEIPESYFDVAQEGQVEIIGWLYQYYNTEPHDQVVNITGGPVKKDDIPAATQLFTTDWVVQYMVDNSLGKYYLERHSDSKIADELTYLLPDEIQHISNGKGITEYRFLDNAMGSGHILVYAFDVFMKMYLEQGYGKREAAHLILENNLYGLEIDTRAYQLAYFALMMKAREYDRRIFTRAIDPNIYVFEDTNDISDAFLDNINDDVTVKNELKSIITEFSNAREIGSLLPIQNQKLHVEQLAEVVKSVHADGLDVDGLEYSKEKILRILQTVQVLAQKYDAVVTNPPYMNKFEPTLKKFIQKNYKDYGKDLFSVFIYNNINMTVDGGYAGYMTPFVWMFIKSYEELRKYVISNKRISSLIQLEYSAFEEATVPIGTFVLQNIKSDTAGFYIKLSNFKGGMDVQRDKVLEAINIPDSNYIYRTNQTNFSKIPGSPIAYWVSKNLLNDFEIGKKLDLIVTPKAGLTTGDNSLFLRQWFEVNINKIKLTAKNLESATRSHKKWFPYNKGGSFRKWSGNYDFVVDWENNGEKIRNFTRGTPGIKSRVMSSNTYFLPAITWSLITSGGFSIRYRKAGSIHDSAGKEAFAEKNVLFQVLGVLNSKLGNYIFKILNPTINMQIGDFRNFPIVPHLSERRIAEIVNNNIEISDFDWNSFENSWNFITHPCLNYIAEHKQNWTIQEAYSAWEKEADDRFNQLKANEEELNRIFIDLYGLQDELTPEEEDKDVSVRRADRERDIKSFLSYFIGCVFGRYSLDVEGLAFAGGDWNADNYQSFKPNEDNIILLTDSEYFDDRRDIINRLREFLTTTFGKNNLDENMQFIAESLDKKKSQKGVAAEDIIRTYFLNDFYKDHDQIYQKRPIYWEFNSGRNKGFKALMYLHRYDSDGLAMIRGYLHDLQSVYEQTVVVRNQQIEIESDTRTKNGLKKEVVKIQKQIDELIKYDEALQHQSMNSIELDLDDGVLVNHAKLQGQEKLLTKL